MPSRPTQAPFSANRQQQPSTRPLPAFRMTTMEEKDMEGVAPLATVDTYWHALKAIERVVVPHAPQEQREVANFLERKRRGLSVGDVVTAFHSTSLPGISFADYATLVAERSGYGHEGVAVGLALMARYAVETKRGVTPLSMHRLFATCMQVGMKATSDQFVKNVYIAALVGMTTPELNSLEVLLLDGLGYNAIPTPATFAALPAALEALHSDSTSSDLYAVLSRCAALSPDYATERMVVVAPPQPVGGHPDPAMPLLELQNMEDDHYRRVSSSLTAHPFPLATASVSTMDDGAYRSRHAYYREGSSTTVPSMLSSYAATAAGPSVGA